MEFHVTLPDAATHIDPILDAVRCVDPSAQMDIDAGGRALRVATSVDAVELLALLDQAGCAVEPDQLVQVPSTCCGSCSG